MLGVRRQGKRAPHAPYGRSLCASSGEDAGLPSAPGRRPPKPPPAPSPARADHRATGRGRRRAGGGVGRKARVPVFFVMPGREAISMLRSRRARVRGTESKPVTPSGRWLDRAKRAPVRRRPSPRRVALEAYSSRACGRSQRRHGPRAACDRSLRALSRGFSKAVAEYRPASGNFPVWSAKGCVARPTEAVSDANFAFGESVNHVLIVEVNRHRGKRCALSSLQQYLG